jgi:hypothetical protein
LSGFGITKLVTECYRGDVNREDKALCDTMRAIRDRLNVNLIVQHPVTPGETITNGNDDARARFLRDKLGDAIDALGPLFAYGRTRKQALKCWDKVFATTFFSEREEPRAKAAASLLRGASAAPVASGFTFPNAPRRDDKPRGFG